MYGIILDYVTGGWAWTDGLQRSGNHSSNTTCLTWVFFENGEECNTLWCSLTRRNARKTNEAVLDK